MGKNMLISAVLLGIFTVVSTALVTVTFVGTHEMVEENERNAFLDQVEVLLPSYLFDNDIFEDRILVKDRDLLGSKRNVVIYRARRDDRPVAAILTPVAPDGYSGDINLMVVVKVDGTLAGARVVSHKETPGLGDKIEEGRSDWITRFTGLSLANPAEEQWKVKKDGGLFDQFSGATITPRAVVKAVHNSLRYYDLHKEEIFTRPADHPWEPHPEREEKHQ